MCWHWLYSLMHQLHVDFLTELLQEEHLESIEELNQRQTGSQTRS